MRTITESAQHFGGDSQMVMREALDSFEGGLKMSGRRVTNLKYADDIILIACSALELQALVDRLDNACTK